MSVKLSSNWKLLSKKTKKDSAGIVKKRKMKKQPKKIEVEKDLTIEDTEPVQKEEIKPVYSLHDDSAPVSDRKKEIGKYLSMDCEFVGVGPDGEESELARVSLVNFHGITILDTFVKPTQKVTDWRTAVSGVTPKHMSDAITFQEAQQKVADLLDGKILVGHGIHHDLEVLRLSHPKKAIRDTSRHLAFRTKYAAGKTPSLKKLCKEILGIDIQGAEHSSVEDAKATMMIYKSDKDEFERLARRNNVRGHPAPVKA